MHEFDIIKRFFSHQTIHRSDVSLSIGDDGAIVKAPSHQDIVITTDTLVAGVHFPYETSAFDIGYKALAVNLSDLAAMGATPAWITLALTLPEANETWLTDFSAGLLKLATQHNIALIGGDLTKGPLTITIQAQGFTPFNEALRRDNAKPSDFIYVTHTLGDAACAIDLLRQNQPVQEVLLTRLNRPEPRVAIGEQLRRIAHAAIDISDGLAADLGHILQQSQVGAILYVDQIPLSHILRTTVSQEEAIAFALIGGDDYELCFTTPKELKMDNITCIGKITKTLGLDLRFTDGKKYNGNINGYQHF
jgi:thiamine-monophosphate kinase